MTVREGEASASPFLYTAGLSVLLSVWLLASAAELPAPGEAADSITVAGEGGQSYALYLPSDYDGETARPILYCFDPRGRGRLCVDLFRAAAEARGWIVAASNNSRSDGPMEPNVAAMKAIWKDTHAKLAIDDRRAYATGFSGGSRVANLMAQLLGLPGVIGCGGGFPPSSPPVREISFAYYGLVGDRDFNYYEMRGLDRTLGSLGIRHRLEIFDGSHRWASAEASGRALVWMELQAMKSGLLPVEEPLVSSYHDLEFARGRGLESSGRGADAWRLLSALADDLRGLRDVSAIEREAARLQASGPVKREIRERRAQDAWSATYLERLPYILERVRSTHRPAPSKRELLAELQIDRLRRRVAREPESESGLSARRLLEMVFVQTSFTQVQALLAEGLDARAALSLAVAVEIRPESATTWYNLACARARSGEGPPALEALGRAVDAGFDDPALLLADPDLESIRSADGFRAVLKRLQP